MHPQRFHGMSLLKDSAIQHLNGETPLEDSETSAASQRTGLGETPSAQGGPTCSDTPKGR